jgi:hypothetical protein
MAGFGQRSVGIPGDVIHAFSAVGDVCDYWPNVSASRGENSLPFPCRAPLGAAGQLSPSVGLAAQLCLRREAFLAISFMTFPRQSLC